MDGEIKERSYIESFTDDMLKKYGLSDIDKKQICDLIATAINEKLYTNTLDYQHNLKHIERVIVYTKMILNNMQSEERQLINKEMEETLLQAVLYHDIGKTYGASNKEHGKVGSKIFKEMTTGKIEERQLEIISALIKQHADEEDKIDFENFGFTLEEQKTIQLMSNILKDADALDRNRLNYPAPIGTCDKSKLRTEAAKDILKLTDSLYYDYCTTTIREKEKNSGSKILDNYELLNQWINEFNNGKKAMFHASLDPSIDILIPKESTQKGAYVYAGISPVNCMTMASFRSSTIFPRTKINGMRAITEIFPGSIEETLGSKYITIYKLPNEKFNEYIAESTAAPTGEWVSKESVKPTEQVSFNALELFNYLIKNRQLGIVQNYSSERQFQSYIKSFEMYMWGIKSIKDNPEAMNQKWQMAQSVIRYYAKNPEEVLDTVNRIKTDVDMDIQKYIEHFKKNYGREPNYDNESECLTPIIRNFEKKYYTTDETGKKKLNYDYINSLTSKNKTQSQNSSKSMTKGFDQRSQTELEIARQIQEKNMRIRKSKEAQRNLNKPKVLTKSLNASTSGFVNALVLTLITGFIAGTIFMVIYNIIK